MCLDGVGEYQDREVDGYFLQCSRDGDEVSRIGYETQLSDV